MVLIMNTSWAAFTQGSELTSGQSLTIGDGSAADISLTFDGSNSDGIIRWDESADEFDIPDHWRMLDNKELRLGNSSDFSMGWITDNNDYAAFMLDVTGDAADTGVLALVELGDEGDANRSPATGVTDPTLRIYSSDATVSTDYFDLFHNQTNAVINVGGGNLLLQTGGNTRLTVEANGDVGIGIADPGFILHVSDSGDTVAAVKLINTSTASGADCIYTQIDAAAAGSGNVFIKFDDAGGGVGSIAGNGTGVDFNTTSDVRVKENIKPLKGALDSVLRFKARVFSPIGSSERKIGFIAQEVFAVEPKLVIVPDDPNEMWSLDYGKFTPLLVGAIQEQQEIIESLKARLAILEQS